ncbi:VOC family protein [Roseovarius sp. SCSIO 43702]|uniref:VOC family protein n=1 Tax=Roseovarius sp. SCSIO 43702 TaxID=2823043 RepID=UPI001C7345AF|nr:VOC family protein [Roseovarius sp. SCSIO 43702]QYX55886.1 VOC family protein [Roseovarius sp. SCSIO 43702]
MLALDHIAVACETLDEGRRWVEGLLGVEMVPGGRHARFGTHNMLLGLADGLYLEVIAIDPEATGAQQPRWFDLDSFGGPPRLGNWICRSTDLDADLARLPGAGTPVSLTRGDLAWRMAVPDTGILPFNDCHPAIMQWDCEAHPAARLPEAGCALRELVVTHPEARDLRARLSPLLQTPLVRYQEGPVALSAIIDTPSGPRALA